MKKSKLYLIGVLLSATSMVGCSDFLRPLEAGLLPEEDFWKYPSYVEGLVGKAYTYMPTNYNGNQGFYFDGATDDAVTTSPTHNMNRLGTGTMGTGNDPFSGSIYQNSYKAIMSVNRFLEDDKGYNVKYSLKENENKLIQNRLQGEALGLRAWFEWELLKHYGGVGINSGELLGISLVTEVWDDINSDDFYTERSSYEESMAQIEKDVTEASKYLAVANRDALKEDGDIEAGGALWGSIDQMALQAMLSDMYLTYASPLFNESDTERWKKAAEQALKVVAMKREIDGATFDETKGVNWNDPNFQGIIFASRKSGSDLGTEHTLYPSSVQGGNGSIGATQELVDAFPMSNGYPITHPEGAKLYDPQDPYANRDARFYATIFYNGAKAEVGNNGAVINTFSAWAGADGYDQTGLNYAGNPGATLTNLYIKKFIYMRYNPNDTNLKAGGPRSKYYYRWAHMLLNFAEAANEYSGPDATFTATFEGTTVTMSAKDAINSLRQRNTSDNTDSSYVGDNDPYLDEVAAQGKDAFREFIRNERRLETCFEGLRFFDLRRWSTEDDLSLLNTTVHRPEIKQDILGNTTYSEGTESNPHTVVVKHKFTTPYLPYPYAEMLRTPKIEQNKGWKNWM